jgi:phage tail-like protein
VWIDAIARTPAVVTLTAPLGGDFTVGRLRLVTPAERLVVDDADAWGAGFPPGTDVAIDWDDAGTVRTTTRTVAWSDPASATVWTTTPAPSTWLAFGPAAAAIATDRGRWLWVKLRLRGARAHATDTNAIATPTIHAMRIVAPRLSYLAYLPAVYSRRDDDDPSGALFLERFLAIAERRLTQIETRYEEVARRLNPAALDRDWIDFIASWFALVFDPSWPTERRARLLAEIFELYRRRGTVEGVRRFVEIYTGHAPSIVEGFQLRPRPGHVLGAGDLLGAAPLGATAAPSTTALDDGYAHRFTIVAYVDDDCDLEVAGTALRALVDAVKPAHTVADLRVTVPDSRVGLESTIGLDFALGDGHERRTPLGALPPTTITIL